MILKKDSAKKLSDPLEEKILSPVFKNLNYNHHSPTSSEMDDGPFIYQKLFLTQEQRRLLEGNANMAASLADTSFAALRETVQGRLPFATIKYTMVYTRYEAATGGSYEEYTGAVDGSRYSRNGPLLGGYETRSAHRRNRFRRG